MEPEQTSTPADTEEVAGAFERMMFRPVPVWLLLLVALLGLAFAVAYGMFVLHAARGGTRLQWLQTPALVIANAPSLLRSAPAAARDPFLSADTRRAHSGL